MSALPFHLADTPLSVEALHLRVTLTHPLGNTSNLHLVKDSDLAVISRSSDAAQTLNHARQGRVIVALGVDDDHDEVLFDRGGNSSTLEVLSEAIEVLETARLAIKRAQRKD